MPEINSSIVGIKALAEKQFLFANSAGQAGGVVSNAVIRLFGIILESSGSGITLNPTTYTFTLSKNSTYKLEAGAAANTTSGDAYLYFGWWNVTTGAWISGTRGSSTVTSGIGKVFGQPHAKSIIHVGASDIQVQLRVWSASNINSVNAEGTFGYIEKIQSVVPINYEFADLWDDLRFPATAINPPGLGSDPTFDSTNIGYAFAPGATNFLYMVAQLPHSYKEGTSLYPHIHWEPSNADTGDVLWRIGWRWRNNGETAAALTTQDLLVPANGTALTLQIDPFGTPLAKGNALISSMLDIQLSRIGGDVTDDFTGNAILKEFDIHYQLDTPGSLMEFSK